MYDIMSLREKQATAKQAFVFLGSLTSKLACETSERALKERICEFDEQVLHDMSRIGNTMKTNEKGVILCSTEF